MLINTFLRMHLEYDYFLHDDDDDDDWGGENLISTYLIDLGLKIVHHFGWHVFAQDFEKIDPLVPGDWFVSSQFDAFLDLLYSRILWDKIGILSLPYRLIAKNLPVFLPSMIPILKGERMIAFFD